MRVHVCRLIAQLLQSCGLFSQLYFRMFIGMLVRRVLFGIMALQVILVLFDYLTRSITGCTQAYLR